MSPKSKTEQDHEGRKNNDRDSEEYRLRRERNNMAVKKSREKSRNKIVQTSVHVEKLKKENDELESKIHTLTKELSLLKELLLSSAGGGRRSNNGDHPPRSNVQSARSLQLLRQVVPDAKSYKNDDF